ncbi:preprotein translocase subunit SecA [Heyndrickxia shackletonii]|uniref:Preprotein translocase subunit SecA n=1 Tax=Heyndrickxia shackletonii TaxID=157838 RepID=A0A0Q3WY04_9BACI|nr:hypothetical protein [Heyndrickxia shackletonii]KQL53959.1 preprotein translocase subunit SecA [Heyndrickxia shackletonii]MBB2478879.1 hypothetical protein [Bacillus sp. APMAM]NEY97755.1 hypothetical protein [Heyndrickxia shackletonii]RTZ57628.1 hypothetical protein EKO25_01510 [Bacillus sp. SAJ1]
MAIVHFFDNKTVVLSQLLKNIPVVDDNIKIKGRKGKVLSVRELDDNQIHVQVLFEQVIKSQTLAKDNKKKKR